MTIDELFNRFILEIYIKVLGEPRIQATDGHGMGALTLLKFQQQQKYCSVLFNILFSGEASLVD